MPSPRGSNRETGEYSCLERTGQNLCRVDGVADRQKIKLTLVYMILRAAMVPIFWLGPMWRAALLWMCLEPFGKVHL